VVLQAMSRGSKAASDVVEMLFLRLVPTIAEMLVLVVIFAVRYGSWRSSLVLLSSFLFYFGLTYKLTNRRTKEHAKANLAGDDAISIASDSLTGFEVAISTARSALRGVPGTHGMDGRRTCFGCYPLTAVTVT
jgi:ABC-type transport system involved in Fe-S cluster assembly fused permease/ATPase subunit